MLENYFKDNTDFEKAMCQIDSKDFETSFEKFLNKLTKEVDTTNGSN